jgi:hypothetical protein
MRVVILRKLSQNLMAVARQFPARVSADGYANPILVVQLLVSKLGGSHGLSRFAFSRNYACVIVSDATS